MAGPGGRATWIRDMGALKGWRGPLAEGIAAHGKRMAWNGHCLDAMTLGRAREGKATTVWMMGYGQATGQNETGGGTKLSACQLLSWVVNASS